MSVRKPERNLEAHEREVEGEMTMWVKEDDPASFLVKTFASWGQWDHLQLIFGAQGTPEPLTSGSIVKSMRSQSTDLLLYLQISYFWAS